VSASDADARRRAERMESARRAGPAAESSGSPSVRVLVVDDHPCFRDTARQILERRGCTVVGQADDAVSALAAVDRLAPDGVLLDVGLGADDGFVVAQAMSRRFPAPSIILMSLQEHSRQRVLESGARAFVLKSQLTAADFSAFWPRGSC
jgi:DNA-binding NarL/FixJ family response regulator